MTAQKQFGKKKVMIVDDEYTIRQLIEMTLSPEYEVLKAASGAEALEILKHTKPSLIILDIMMPNMDGYSVCKKIKSDEKDKDIPIIILTAKHGIEDVKSAIKVDCDEFITKPFEPDHLKRRVDVYLGEDEKEKSTEQKFFQYGKSLHYIKEK